MSKENALYTVLAEYYDRIFHWKNYRNETETLMKLIRAHKRSPGNTLLDVACGTGEHIKYLKNDFRCVGIDISEQMLKVAREKVLGTKFIGGDMVNFDLGKRFDIILCLFSSIGYLRTRSLISNALRNFSNHLEIGGVLIIEPWIRKSEWKDKSIHLQTYENDDLKIVRVDFNRMKGNFSILDERYLIVEENMGVTYLKTLHKMRFFELEATLQAMKSAGFHAKFTEKSLMPGRGLLIGVKER